MPVSSYRPEVTAQRLERDIGSGRVGPTVGGGGSCFSDNRVYLLNSVGKDQDDELCAAPRIRKGSGPPALWEVTQEVSRALGKHCLGLGNRGGGQR